ncbi:MAG TPA: heme-binding protein [Terriglobia bacterium]|nr:heme-binding protein [Terriglobia bacterium]
MRTPLIPLKTVVVAASLACSAGALPADAELLTEKNLSAAVAFTIAQTAYESCAQQGYHVSVHVVGREGQVLVAIRGDGSSPHTFENSLRKAYTARTFRVPSGEFAQRVKDNPTLGVVHLPGVIALQGALPIKVGDDVVGAVGVSGAPGGDKDEACSKAGIDRVAAQLN